MGHPLTAGQERRELWGGLWRRSLQVLVTQALIGLCLFVAAGDLGWGRAWLLLALSVALFALSGAVVWRHNPEIIVERSRRHQGTRTFDRVVGAVLGPLMLAVFVVAGLDAVRFGWAPLPAWTLWPGLLLTIAGMVPITWSMAVNRHLETTVRVQHERGHQVVDVGPYAHVRHPMYLGMLLQYLGEPLLLGSAWALLPALGVVATMSARIVLEERTLRAELPGYAAYAARTRFRLVPGLW